MRFVIAAALTALGFWVGGVLAPERETPSDRTGSSLPAESPDGAIAPREGAVEASNPSALTPPLAVEPPRPTSPADLLPILARFPARPYEVGEGVISGRVTDEHGAPAAGIAFDLLVDGTTPGVEPAGVRQPSALAFALESIDQHHFDTAHLRRAVSGEDGTFTFDRISPERTYHVEPGASNRAAVIFESSRRELAAGDEIVALALPAVPVTIEVVDVEGQSIRSAEVRMWGEVGGETRHLLEPYRGEPIEVRLPLSHTSFYAWSNRGGAVLEEDVVLHAGEPARVRLEIHESPTMTLELAGGEDSIERVGLEARLISLAAIEVLPEDLRKLVHEGRPFPFGVGQRMRCRVSPGEYLVLLIRDDSVIAQREVVVATGDTVVPFTVPPVDRSTLAMVSVLSPDGHPVSSVSFGWVAEISDEEEVVRILLPLRATHLGSGRFALRLEPAGLAVDMQPLGILAVSAVDFGRKELPIRFGSEEEYRVQFDPPARLVAELIDYAGHELQGNAAVELWRNGERIASDLCEVSGLVEFEGLSPGPLTVRLTDSAHTNPLGHEIELTLRPGENFVRVPLPEAFSVVLRFPLELVDSFVFLISEGQAPYAGWIDDDGRVEFRGVPRGRYSVEFHGGHGAMTVDVPTLRPIIEFLPTATDALRVRIDDSQGVLARLGFRSDDLVLAVAGTTTENDQRLQFALLRAIGEGSGAVEVARGGSRFTVQIEGGVEDLNIRDLGGKLIPAARGGRR